jgi:hypothetical protein
VNRSNFSGVERKKINMNDPKVAGTVVVVLCVVVVISLLIGAVIAGVILRVACRICGVKEPSLLRAMGVVFLNSVVNLIFNVAVMMIAGMRVIPTQMSSNQIESIGPIQLICLPVNMILSAGIFSMTLENVSFGKGILIWLAQSVIFFFLAFVIGIAFGALGMMPGTGGRR